MAAVISNDALRFACCAGGVQNVQRVRSLYRHTFRRFSGGFYLFPVKIAAGLHLGFGHGSLINDAFSRLVGGDFDSFIEQGFVRNYLLDFDATGRGQDNIRLCVINSDRQFSRGKTTENHRMDSADTRACEH